VLASYRTLCVAIRDPRVQRSHLKVLANITEKISYETGTAFPVRRTVAAEEGLSEESVENAVYELRKWLYMHWERRSSPEQHQGRLLHYTLRAVSVTRDDIAAAIEQWCIKNKKEVHLPGCTKSTPPRVENGHKLHLPGCTLKYTAGGGEYTAGGVQHAKSTPPRVENFPKSTPQAVTRSRLSLSKSVSDRAEQALVLYNEAARAHGFSVCQKLTDVRRKRLEKRLEDIGGVDQFQIALSAIPGDDWLMGRAAARNGQEPFRLDLERLLSTESRMGDVLARLIDRAMDGGTSRSDSSDVPDFVRQFEKNHQPRATGGSS
jgi:hypothetical protein